MKGLAQIQRLGRFPGRSRSRSASGKQHQCWGLKCFAFISLLFVRLELKDRWIPACQNKARKWAICSDNSTGAVCFPSPISRVFLPSCLIRRQILATYVIIINVYVPKILCVYYDPYACFQCFVPYRRNRYDIFYLFVTPQKRDWWKQGSRMCRLGCRKVHVFVRIWILEDLWYSFQTYCNPVSAVL